MWIWHYNMAWNTRQNSLHRVSVSVTDKSSIVPRAQRACCSAKNAPDTPMSYPYLMRGSLTTPSTFPRRIWSVRSSAVHVWHLVSAPAHTQDLHWSLAGGTWRARLNAHVVDCRRRTLAILQRLPSCVNSRFSDCIRLQIHAKHLITVIYIFIRSFSQETGIGSRCCADCSEQLQVNFKFTKRPHSVWIFELRRQSPDPRHYTFSLLFCFSQVHCPSQAQH